MNRKISISVVFYDKRYKKSYDSFQLGRDTIARYKQIKIDNSFDEIMSLI